MVFETERTQTNLEVALGFHVGCSYAGSSHLSLRPEDTENRGPLRHGYRQGPFFQLALLINCVAKPLAPESL